MKSYFAHKVLQWACWRGDRRFASLQNQLKQVQLARLQHVLHYAQNTQGKSLARKITCYEDFTKLPITRYADWKVHIEAARQHGVILSSSPIVRYQPTSGSSQAIKFIPYTQSFLAELDAAIVPWIASLYRQHPKLKQGVHYWSISWLPESQRHVLNQGNLNDDSALLSVGKRVLSQLTQAVPSEIAFAANAEDALFATLAYLLAQPSLAMISVWSPTFAIGLLDKLQLHADELIDVLATGDWGSRALHLQHIKAPHDQQRAQTLRRLKQSDSFTPTMLWKNLTLVSSWDTACAKPWAHKLQHMLPNTAFEGKGLWATEGVVSIPYNGKYPLAYHSHFYEFEDIRSGRIKPAWELQLGDEVSPILSSSNGLLRYAMDDHIVVNDFMGQVPCFQFIGRRNTVDLVGEKIDYHLADQVVRTLSEHKNIEPLALLAIDGEGEQISHYRLLVTAESLSESTQLELNSQLEQLLQQHFHYELARNLDQLQAATVWIVQDAWKVYQQLCMAAGMIEGNVKIEVLKRFSLSVYRNVVTIG